MSSVPISVPVAPSSSRGPSNPNTVTDEDVKSAELLRAMEEEFSQLKDPRKRTVLREFFDACDRGDLNIVKKLAPILQNSGSLILQDEDDNLGWTALHYASFRGRVSVVGYLLETFRFPTQIVDKTLRTPLHSAVASPNCKMEVVELLLKFGAEVDAKDKSDWTPLHIAVFRVHAEMVRFLVEKAGANPEAVGSLGTPADLAGNNKDLLNALSSNNKSIKT